ncbi:ABC transporter ATP-binding protein [Miniphocaeibacter halophilus]|uniref:ATP-binding cassette domain-containing protein n=1 Tax=Miniphocaeibacter halophilus TaxID=2931922 RepID=A0AC61MRV0_9FIRM|nr:ATP-binding cassette domain-containing protein [Miniphocaeibacter halophilus]QQK08241.1 ATP-binding cassette domain-containing protein [Miniphocaeibacter halophilus]
MLELKNIGYNATNEDGSIKEILKNVNLTVDTDSFVVITGPNGSGKSTLAKIIMGLEKPTTGQIFLDGKDITNLNITDRANTGVGFAFQQPVRFKGLTVRDLLRFASGKNLSTHEACDYLSQVGLCAINYVNRELNDSLSGGEMKRIEIAMLMARQVKLSIFDEPEAGIDLWSFNNLIEVFKKLKETTKGSIMIISHQERILDIADKVVVLANGTITAEGRKDEILPSLLSTQDICELYVKEV